MNRRFRSWPTRVLALGLAGIVAGACPGDDGDDDGDDGVEPAFPDDYEASYVEVRNCRGSGDHDLHNIRILVDPTAAAAYEGRTEPFGEGAVVMKEEYDFGDVSCSGDIVQWTVMRKLAEGSSPQTLGWAWQQVDLSRRVVAEDGQRCISCHQGCGVAPDGYDWTCSIPP